MGNSTDNAILGAPPSTSSAPPSNNDGSMGGLFGNIGQKISRIFNGQSKTQTSPPIPTHGGGQAAANAASSSGITAAPPSAPPLPGGPAPGSLAGAQAPQPPSAPPLPGGPAPGSLAGAQAPQPPSAPPLPGGPAPGSLAGAQAPQPSAMPQSSPIGLSPSVAASQPKKKAGFFKKLAASIGGVTLSGFAAAAIYGIYTFATTGAPALAAAGFFTPFGIGVGIALLVVLITAGVWAYQSSKSAS